MKELSIEEKAKAYDRAKEKIVLRFGSNVAEEIFSEFDESEDEKIISAIRKVIEAKVENLGNGVTRTACLAWLEKQGKPIDEEKVLIGARKDAALSIMKFLDRCTLGMCLSSMECADLEDAVVNSDWSKVYDYMKKKLEKQCEKPQGKSALDAINEEKVDNQNCVKPSVKGEPKFKVGDYVVDNCGYVWRIEGIINQFYILEGIDGGESRPTIEWVNKTFHLWDITEDAKNGDVLASKDEKDILIFRRIEPSTSFSSYYNIKGRGNYGWCDSYFIPATKEQRNKLEKSMAYAGYVFDFEKKELKKIEDEEYDGDDYGIDGLWHAKNILEKTLGKVDGYQTDDGILDHKCAISFIDKLYKQKPAEWSEEDESNFQGIIDVIKENKHHTTDYEHMIYYKLLSWFKSLKERYVWKPSDEQMKALDWALSLAKNCGNECAFELRTLQEQLKKI